jgi:uncharacterized ion transporter superfamily protein YfcC
VLFFVLVLIWILTFIIPPGSYSYVSCDGGTPRPVPGTFGAVKVDLSFQERLYDLGYDRLVGVGIIMVGAGVGTLASTVNPFATGVASDAAGVALGDGIGLRLIMYVLFVVLALMYVLWYARRVKADSGPVDGARRRGAGRAGRRARRGGHGHRDHRRRR